MDEHTDGRMWKLYTPHKHSWLWYNLSSVELTKGKYETYYVIINS